MPEDTELDGFDPFDAFDQEAARLTRWYLHRQGDEWHRPTRCEGWDVQDVMAHLAGGEVYNQACLDGTVAELMENMGKSGVTSLDEANNRDVEARRGRDPLDVVEEWREANADTRKRLREIGDGDITTSVGPYPAKWQAWHLASELATHADDAGVPITDEERDERLEWRGAFARFAITESHPELTVAFDGGTGDTTVREPGGGFEVTLGDEQLVEAVNHRIDGEAGAAAAAQERLGTV